MDFYQLADRSRYIDIDVAINIYIFLSPDWFCFSGSPDLHKQWSGDSNAGLPDIKLLSHPFRCRAPWMRCTRHTGAVSEPSRSGSISASPGSWLPVQLRNQSPVWLNQKQYPNKTPGDAEVHCSEKRHWEGRSFSFSRQAFHLPHCPSCPALAHSRHLINSDWLMSWPLSSPWYLEFALPTSVSFMSSSDFFF